MEAHKIMAPVSEIKVMWEPFVLAHFTNDFSMTEMCGMIKQKKRTTATTMANLVIVFLLNIFLRRSANGKCFLKKISIKKILRFLGSKGCPRSDMLPWHATHWRARRAFQQATIIKYGVFSVVVVIHNGK